MPGRASVKRNLQQHAYARSNKDGMGSKWRSGTAGAAKQSNVWPTVSREPWVHDPHFTFPPASVIVSQGVVVEATNGGAPDAPVGARVSSPMNCLVGRLGPRRDGCISVAGRRPTVVEFPGVCRIWRGES